MDLWREPPATMGSGGSGELPVMVGGMDSPLRNGVQATNDDASASKLSCVSKGYIEDEYVRFFVKRPVKRSPIINRGYYARWAGIRKLLLQFLKASNPGEKEVPRKQVLSLGAGFDTLFFQLKDEGLAPHLFVELDFMEVTSRKAAIISSHEELLAKLGPEPVIHQEKGEIFSENYKLLAADLKDLEGLDTVFEQAGLDPSLPTIIIAECVLIYLDPDVSRAVIKWASEKLTSSVFVIYEQIHPDDAFGHQMIKNLETRGCPLLGLEDTPTLESKVQRFTELGWQRGDALDMDILYNQHLELGDRKRIERLEIFDEFEEWHIMQGHYCIAFGVKDPTGIFEHVSFASQMESSPHYGSPHVGSPHFGSPHYVGFSPKKESSPLSFGFSPKKESSTHFSGFSPKKESHTYFSGFSPKKEGSGH